eukprot:UN3058
MSRSRSLLSCLLTGPVNFANGTFLAWSSATTLSLSSQSRSTTRASSMSSTYASLSILSMTLGCLSFLRVDMSLTSETDPAGPCSLLCTCRWNLLMLALSLALWSSVLFSQSHQTLERCRHTGAFSVWPFSRTLCRWKATSQGRRAGQGSRAHRQQSIGSRPA